MYRFMNLAAFKNKTTKLIASLRSEKESDPIINAFLDLKIGIVENRGKGLKGVKKPFLPPTG